MATQETNKQSLPIRSTTIIIYRQHRRKQSRSVQRFPLRLSTVEQP